MPKMIVSIYYINYLKRQGLFKEFLSSTIYCKIFCDYVINLKRKDLCFWVFLKKKLYKYMMGAGEVHRI